MKRCACLLILILLSGCAITQRQSIDLAPGLTRAEHQQIVSDAVGRLAALYPPAKTRLSLRLSDRDSFGIMLAQDLRGRGYALQKAVDNKPQSPSGLPVRYILDRTGDMYRITIFIRTDSLSRPYLLQNGVLIPAGLWVHKEHGHE